MTTMENIAIFGSRSCVGILSEPRALRQNVPAVIILNAGLLHSVGPYRLHVSLARNLSDRGFYVLRFDLAGIGDSGPRSNALSERENALTDMQAAMDFVTTKTGISEFVFMGLCSGADHAHQIAVADLRVKGVVALDGYAYPTVGFYLRKFTKHIREPSRVFDIFKLRLSNIFLGESAEDGEYDFGQFPPRKRVAREMTSLVERGVNMLYVYSGAWPSFNHVRQFEKMFPSVDFQNKLAVVNLVQADHTYTLLEDRAELVDTVLEWMSGLEDGSITENSVLDVKKI